MSEAVNKRPTARSVEERYRQGFGGLPTGLNPRIASGD
jgi:hypothetical protein